MSTPKKALITGIAGQDGSYLAEFLLSKGYDVHGIIRWDSSFHTERLDHIYKDPHQKDVHLFFWHGDVTDSGNVEKIIKQVEPNEVYHLAAQSHVRVSFDMPEYTSNTDALGTLRLLESIKNTGLPIRFYMAASSEMFGSSSPPQNEHTLFQPRSPYACAKIFSYHITKMYREAYNIFAANGILFNHESPRRGPTFVTRKITRGIARIKAGIDKKLYLGNLEAKRDWGYAPEYVEAMWKMLQQTQPDDFVIATDETHSVKEFLETAFSYAGFDNWKTYVEIDPFYFRPSEVEVLIGDSSKAKKIIGWKPQIVCKDLARIMIDADFRALQLTPPGDGDRIIAEKFPHRWWRAD